MVPRALSGAQKNKKGAPEGPERRVLLTFLEAEKRTKRKVKRTRQKLAQGHPKGAHKYASGSLADPLWRIFVPLGLQIGAQGYKKVSTRDPE